MHSYADRWQSMLSRPGTHSGEVQGGLCAIVAVVIATQVLTERNPFNVAGAMGVLGCACFILIRAGGLLTYASNTYFLMSLLGQASAIVVASSCQVNSLLDLIFKTTQQQRAWEGACLLAGMLWASQPLPLRIVVSTFAMWHLLLGVFHAIITTRTGWPGSVALYPGQALAALAGAAVHLLVVRLQRGAIGRVAVSREISGAPAGEAEGLLVGAEGDGTSPLSDELHSSCASPTSAVAPSTPSWAASRCGASSPSAVQHIASSDITIVCRIGRGGHATVFKGCWLGSDVAVKVYRSVSINKALMSEAETLAKLRHPCVCSFFGASVRDTGLSLIMELLEISLHHMLHVAESTPTHALCHRIARQTANGLAYLHLNGIMHRDIKPANVSTLPAPRPRAARTPHAICSLRC